MEPWIATPFVWFFVNMGAWAAMGGMLWRYMKALGDKADDVLLLQLAPINERLLSLENLERFLAMRDVQEECIELAGAVHKRQLSWHEENTFTNRRRWGCQPPDVTLSFDEANKFLLGATLEFADKGRWKVANEGEALGVVENRLKHVFFAALVEAGVLSVVPHTRIRAMTE